jgi:hypothetical protein
MTYGDVWFNGYEHLRRATGARGAVQGETLSARLTARGLPWNRAFGCGPIVVPDTGRLPRRTLPGQLRLTLLSPTREELRDLLPRWEREVRRAGLMPGVGVEEPEEVLRRALPPELEELRAPLDPERLAAEVSRPDDGEPNGSSIAVLAEYRGRRLLLTGDAYAATLATSLRRLMTERRQARLPLDAFKLPHHGSQGNITRALLEQVRCPRYLFSTNGAVHQHPDRQAVARVLVHGGDEKALLFNYRTRYTELWGAQPALQDRYGYAAMYPPASGDSMRLSF